MENLRSWTFELRHQPPTTVLTVLGILGLGVCLINYTVLTIRSRIRAQSKKDGRHPPDLPYFVPFVGHILSVARSQSAFLQDITLVYSNKMFRIKN